MSTDDDDNEHSAQNSLKRARTQFDADDDYSQNRCVEINVGGRIFAFNAQTLHTAPSGLLANMFGPSAQRFGGITCRDSRGLPYIEMDATDFEIVAYYLRTKIAHVHDDRDYERARRALSYCFFYPPKLVTTGILRLQSTRVYYYLRVFCDQIRAHIDGNWDEETICRDKIPNRLVEPAYFNVPSRGHIENCQASVQFSMNFDARDGPTLVATFVWSTVFGHTTSAVPHVKKLDSPQAVLTDEMSRVTQCMIDTIEQSRPSSVAYSMQDVCATIEELADAKECRAIVTTLGSHESSTGYRRRAIDFQVVFWGDSLPWKDENFLKIYFKK